MDAADEVTEATVAKEVPMVAQAPITAEMETMPPEGSPTRETLATAGGSVAEGKMPPLEAPRAGHKEAWVNSQHPEAEATPTGDSSPSSPRGGPRVDPRMPSRGTHGLPIPSGTSYQRVYCVDAIQAAHHYLDKLGVDMAAEEKRLGMEHGGEWP
jgi:hypothetical protein